MKDIDWKKKYLEEKRKNKELREENDSLMGHLDQMNNDFWRLRSHLPPAPELFKTTKEQIFFILLMLHSGELFTKWKGVSLGANERDLSRFVEMYTNKEIPRDTARKPIHEILVFFHDLPQIYVEPPKNITSDTINKFIENAKNENLLSLKTLLYQIKDDLKME